MNRIHSILLVTAAAFSINVAYAQTPSASTGTAPGAAPEMRIVTSTTDPLVQKRKDNAQANKEYKQNKQAAKEQYKGQMAAAKMDHKQLKKDAATNANAAMAGEQPAAPLQAIPVNK